MREGSAIELTQRQHEILELVKKHSPITGDQIAEDLGVSKPTIRSDLAVLVMLQMLDAKPKVGYFPGNALHAEFLLPAKLTELKVKDIQGRPVIILETANVHDAVVTLFLENVGSLIVTDEQGELKGIVSRKDLLKVTLGSAETARMPVSLVMTRQPNLVTIGEEESVLEAAARMIRHQVDGLPVIRSRQPSGNADAAVEIVGRVTKTHMTQVLLDLAAE